MNGALRTALAGVPEQTIKSVCGSIAVGAAAAILLMGCLVHPLFGKTVAYGVLPLAVVVAVSAILAMIRLCLVGFLPSDVHAEDVIPSRLQPWIRGWLLVRFGLLGSGLLIVIVGLMVAVAKRDLVGLVVEAFVYLVWCRILLDAAFNAAFNAGVILSRR